MQEPLHAYIGLGSNLGDRLAALQEAVSQLHRSEGLTVDQVSEVYECKPMGYESEHDYLNAVVECHYEGPPLQLAELCYKIETAGGRHKAGANPPRFYQDRTIDLDLIHIDDVETADERLTLPHPRAHERGFVLVPLMELAPELVLSGKPVEQWLQSLPVDEIKGVVATSHVLVAE